MGQQIIISNLDEVCKYRNKIINNANKSIHQLKAIIDNSTELEVFYQLKFKKCGTEPDSGEPENFIEIVNQLHTYLVSASGIEYLIKKHPDKSFMINLGNLGGNDIVSTDGMVIAECFAATKTSSNGKLADDLKRLAKNTEAEYKYEFFYSCDWSEKTKEYYNKKYPDIEIIRFAECK